MSAMARQKSHQWTVPGFPEHVSQHRKGPRTLGQMSLWKPANQGKSRWQCENTRSHFNCPWMKNHGTCGQTCPNDIKSLKKCLKHVKFLGDHEWDFTRAVGQQHQAINKPYASNEGEGCVLQLWAELRCYPQIPVGLDMFLQITLAEIETARLGQKL